MATDKPRYTVSVSDEMFKQIEDFRFANRFGTRTDATIELIRLGLEALRKEQNPGDDWESIRQALEAADAEQEQTR